MLVSWTTVMYVFHIFLLGVQIRGKKKNHQVSDTFGFDGQVEFVCEDAIFRVHGASVDPGIGQLDVGYVQPTDRMISVDLKMPSTVTDASASRPTSDDLDVIP